MRQMLQKLLSLSTCLEGCPELEVYYSITDDIRKSWCHSWGSPRWRRSVESCAQCRIPWRRACTNIFRLLAVSVPALRVGNVKTSFQSESVAVLKKLRKFSSACLAIPKSRSTLSVG